MPQSARAGQLARAALESVRQAKMIPPTDNQLSPLVVSNLMRAIENLANAIIAMS